MEQELALVLGASGGIGGEVARQLQRAGWRVRAMSRRPPQDAQGIEWLQGDALVGTDVARAARGCAVIVHAVNPPGYRNWAGQVVPMLRNTIAAAEKHGALVLLPGTVYNYGPDAFPLAPEHSPQHPLTRKGALRVQMEEELAAHAARGGRVLIVRAGDFFGPQAGNNWFAQGLVKKGRAPAAIANPGLAGAGHQWAYLPDVAATMVALLARRTSLAPFARFHFEGYWDEDGEGMARAIRQVAAKHGIQARITRFPWWLVRLMAPFHTTMRELLEMRYLWREPLRLDNARLLAVLGAEPRTPLLESVEQTLLGQGCLPAPALTFA